MVYSYRIPHSNKNKWTTGAQKNMDNAHGHFFVEQKKAGPKDNICCNFVYVKFKSRQDSSMVTCMRSGSIDREEAWRRFLLRWECSVPRSGLWLHNSKNSNITVWLLYFKKIISRFLVQKDSSPLLAVSLNKTFDMYWQSSVHLRKCFHMWPAPRSHALNPLNRIMPFCCYLARGQPVLCGCA